MDEDPPSPSRAEVTEEFGVALSKPTRVRKRNRQFDDDFVGAEQLSKRRKAETPTNATSSASVTRAKTRSAQSANVSKSATVSATTSAKKKAAPATKRTRAATKSLESKGNHKEQDGSVENGVSLDIEENSEDVLDGNHRGNAKIELVKSSNPRSPSVESAADEKSNDSAVVTRRSTRRAAPSRKLKEAEFVSPVKPKAAVKGRDEGGKKSTKNSVKKLPARKGARSVSNDVLEQDPLAIPDFIPQEESSRSSVLSEQSILVVERLEVIESSSSNEPGVKEIANEETIGVYDKPRTPEIGLDAESALSQLEELLGESKTPEKPEDKTETYEIHYEQEEHDPSGDSEELPLTPEPPNEILIYEESSPTLMSSPMNIPSLTAALNKKSVSIKKRSARKRKRAYDAVAAAEAARRRAGVITKHFRNFLKLPKAHRWISYEFFYSHVDEPIFHHENDFMTCVRESFPKLEDTKLTRTEWSYVRRTLGRPRRCSEAFFAQERRTLERKREKIRLIQACKLFPEFGEEYVPEMIPIPMSIGMRVTAKLTKPLNGLFDGVLQAVNTHENTYRIKFDRPDVGSQTVPDFDVSPDQPGMLLPVAQYLGKIRRPANATGTVIPPFSPLKTPSKSMPHSIDQSPMNSPARGNADSGLPAVDVPLKARLLEGNLSQFPLQSLVNIVRVKKLLDTKHQKLEELKQFNRQAEISRAQGKSYTLPFQRKYASLILDLETLNADLNMVLKDVNEYCREVAPEKFPKSFSMLKEVTEQQSRALVWTCYVQSNADGSQEAGGSAPQEAGGENQPVPKESVVSLVTKILALLLQIKSFADSGAEWNVYDLRALTDTLAEAKASLHPANRPIFEAAVEVQIRQVLAAMSHSKQATAGIERMLRPPEDLSVENG